MFSFIIQSLMNIYFCPKRFGIFFENHRTLTKGVECTDSAESSGLVASFWAGRTIAIVWSGAGVNKDTQTVTRFPFFLDSIGNSILGLYEMNGKPRSRVTRKSFFKWTTSGSFIPSFSWIFNETSRWNKNVFISNLERLSVSMILSSFEDF